MHKLAVLCMNTDNNISTEEFKQMINNGCQCIHCRVDCDRTSKDGAQLILDCIDNGIAHTTDNIQISCWACNRQKK